MTDQLEIDVDGIEDLESAKTIIKMLLARLRKVEEEVAVLKKDSSTSSKPPSSDITKPKSQQRQPGKRKRGGQRGHKGIKREMLPPEEVDEVVEIPAPRSCPECCGQLSEEEAPEVLVQQSVELPEKPVQVTEYHRHGKFCPCCNAYYYPPLPDGVLEDQLFGSSLQALVGYMKGNLGASYTELQEFCKDVLQISVSRSMLCNTVARVSKAIKAPVDELGAAIREEKALNIDETGWKDSGSKYWVWVFCNQLIAYFVISKTRGSKVLREVLGETFGGAITSDCYGAYIGYASHGLQLCLAHLIRDIKFLTTLKCPQSKEFGEIILEYFRDLFKLWHNRGSDPPEKFQAKADRLKRNLFTYLTNTELEKGKALTLKKRVMRQWDNLFRFVYNPELYQPTNNTAEQAVRHTVRIRRQTQGSRSQSGRDWNARIMTVLATCKKQRRSSWNFIKDSLEAQYFNQTFPTLLAT
jgi:transposase